jgi:hypothetical protein
MHDQRPTEPHWFENHEWLEANRMAVEAYAALRARGIYKMSAFRQVFGSVNCVYPEVHIKIENLEASFLYNGLFETLLKVTPIDHVLNDRRALHSYLDIANNPLLKESVRVQALKEACVLAGITVIDDANRTRKVPTLADLYEEHGAALEARAKEGGYDARN